jgi:CubicO group peptidase (beta-lactamase class C family)
MTPPPTMQGNLSFIRALSVVSVVISLSALACSQNGDGNPGVANGGTSSGATGGMSVAAGGASPDGGIDPNDGGEGGDAPVQTDDAVGIFAPANNYFELNTEAPLRFHFGASNITFGSVYLPLAGDFDGDGFDTVALYAPAELTFNLSDANDSDEFAPRGTSVVLQADLVPPPAVSLDQASPPHWPIAGDWDGDGTSGLGLYDATANTFYLRNSPTTGAPDFVLELAPNLGYPAGGLPIAGDFDGDGRDDVGISDGTKAYLHFGLDAAAPDVTVDITGLVVAGDFDGDGVDTLASFDTATNRFAIFNSNGAEAASDEFNFGHSEPAYWTWLPLVGHWQVPEAPVASAGYEWSTATPESEGIDAAALEAVLSDAASTQTILSVLVARNGELVGERYYHGFERHIASNIKSVSKSVLSSLFGIAFERGDLGDLSDPVAGYLPTYFPESIDAEKKTINLGHLFNMTAGFDWNEWTGNSVVEWLLSPDYVANVVERSLVSAPGAAFTYDTGLTHLGSAALTEASGMSTRDFAQQFLLEPLGISIPRWDRAPEGYFIGGAEMWMRPRDLARIGELYRNGGSLDGNAIVPAAWVAASVDPTIDTVVAGRYGLWWRERDWANYAVGDSYMAWGYGGQFLFVFPARNLVIVVTSSWNVDAAQDAASDAAIFDLVDSRILPIVGG